MFNLFFGKFRLFLLFCFILSLNLLNSKNKAINKELLDIWTELDLILSINLNKEEKQVFLSILETKVACLYKNLKYKFIKKTCSSKINSVVEQIYLIKTQFLEVFGKEQLLNINQVFLKIEALLRNLVQSQGQYNYLKY